MILTDYYLFKHLPECASVMRRDCVASTKSYPELEALRNKKNELFVYFGDLPERFAGDVKRKATKCLTKTKNISSLFVPDITRPYAFGDIASTQDCILIEHDQKFCTLELFVARGQRCNQMQLYNLFAEGELAEEVQALRAAATGEREPAEEGGK